MVTDQNGPSWAVDDPPKYHASIGFKKNLGNYESIDFSFGIAGVTQETLGMATAEAGEVFTQLYDILIEKIEQAAVANGAAPGAIKSALEGSGTPVIPGEAPLPTTILPPQPRVEEQAQEALAAAAQVKAEAQALKRQRRTPAPVLVEEVEEPFVEMDEDGEPLPIETINVPRPETQQGVAVQFLVD